ncbi:helix-turn-helix domain-containing protein [Streptomyces sp. NPDC093108]|uniref:helix-turn-helix domain-containing protein n=1 Tax=Streptomyces sp. NPDC093108 TaxID=3366030 RepID=UPI0037F616F0
MRRGRADARGQAKWELLRLGVAARFERGGRTEDIARYLRVTARSVRRWRHAWHTGGPEALRARGPMAVERLSPAQWERLGRELKRGPLAYGFKDESQGCSPKRITLVIGRLFHVGYTIQGAPPRFERAGAYAAGAGAGRGGHRGMKAEV